MVSACAESFTFFPGVDAEFIRNKPYTAVTLFITIGSNIVLQEVEEGEPIKWTGKTSVYFIGLGHDD